jgi:hypothetical protein
MRTHLVFRNAILNDDDANDSNPAGRRLSNLIAENLLNHGFQVKRVVMEDWGWVILIENKVFPLWIGCSIDPDQDDGHLCFIRPDKAKIRRWFKSIDTTRTVDRLATALEDIVKSAQHSSDLRWWSEDESRIN